MKVSDETNPLLSGGACQAIGEIGRNATLPLPPGDESSPEGEITQLSVVKQLVSIIKSGKESSKVGNFFFSSINVHWMAFISIWFVKIWVTCHFWYFLSSKLWCPITLHLIRLETLVPVTYIRNWGR